MISRNFQLPNKINKRFNFFIDLFLKQTDPGLLIIEESLSCIIKGELFERGFSWAANSGQLLGMLYDQEDIFVEITQDTPKNMVSIIHQCAVRYGMVQVVDAYSKELVAIQYDPHLTHILLLVTEPNFFIVERLFSLRKKVGMIERLTF